MRTLLLALALVLPGPALAQSWVEITPTEGPTPPPRRHASAIHDVTNDRMVIFGGENGTGRLNDVWAYDLTTEQWTDLTPASGSAPSPRRTPGSVYDPAGERMVTWSGQGGGFFNDVWSFDLTNHTWTEHTPDTPLPNPRYGVASIYDPLSGELVTFAGFTNAGRFEDTWRFDPATETWTDVSPATGPIERCLHSASYDSRLHRMIMYAGQNNGPLDDIWAFDLASETWTELTPATVPDGRFFTAHVYDARNHRSTIFGGNRGAGLGVTNEVWLFDLFTNEFVEMTPSGSPPTAREGSAAIYFEDEDRMVVFGGYDTDYRSDLWSLESLSQTATDTPAAPTAERLVVHPNRPNPFNPRTTIRFELPRSGTVDVTIFDARGRRVRTLMAAERLEAGPHSVPWSGLDDEGRSVTSGVYVARVVAGGETSARKMVLVE